MGACDAERGRGYEKSCVAMLPGKTQAAMKQHRYVPVWFTETTK